MSASCLHCGFFLSDDKSTADFPQKTSRNNIFSSVKNNPESGSRSNKPTAQSMDFSRGMADSMPTFISDKAGESKPQKTFAERDENIAQKKPAVAVKQAPAKKVETEDAVEKLIEEKTEHKQSGVLYQNKHDVQDSATIAFNFEEASLSNLVSYISE